MRSTFVVPFPPGASLPPMDSDDGYCLHYTDAEGKLAGGFSCIGLVPQAPTCIVLVDTSNAVNALMKADARYIHIEDVVEVADASE